MRAIWQIRYNQSDRASSRRPEPSIKPVLSNMTWRQDFSKLPTEFARHRGLNTMTVQLRRR